jgi:hypothetical protein
MGHTPFPDWITWKTCCTERTNGKKPPACKKHVRYTAGSSAATTTAGDVEAMRAKGVKVVMEPNDEPWGTRPV